MNVGVVTEIKEDENRVALLPVGVETLIANGHHVLVESGCGTASGYDDMDYSNAGAEVVADPAQVFERSELILKVKEPLAQEYSLIQSKHTVMTYFHFAASSELTKAIRKSGCTAIAYETIQTEDGQLPLLKPMSEVAGRMSVQQAAKYLEREHGGRGILLGGVPGVAPANVVILGAGTVGTNAARMAAGLGAKVYILDTNLDRLRYLSEIMPPNVFTLMSQPDNIRRSLRNCDVVISSVLIPGAKAPMLLRKHHLGTMRKGAVIVDVAIDQGGTTEMSRPTTHANPIYKVDDIVYYCVSNMPGTMPMTATLALTNATLNYILEIANKGWERAADENPAIAKGVNISDGEIVHPNLAETFKDEPAAFDELVKN